MKTKGYTSLEQSKKLLELGLSPESADMCYYKLKDTDDKGWRVLVDDYSEDKSETLELLPCWSLAVLLELMPVLEFDATKQYITPLEMVQGRLNRYGSYINAAVATVCWLLENKYI